MARNGAGTYALPAGNPVVNGTVISDTWANTTLSDISTALTASIANDGQTPVLANLPMGTHKLTGLAAGTASGDSVALDANANVAQNNFVQGYTTTATAAGTTTLLASSTGQQFFTGATTQIVQMPVTSTLTLGHTYLIANNSSGIITVNSSGGNQIILIPPYSNATLTCILTSGTTASSWHGDIQVQQTNATGSVIMPVGTTAQRDAAPIDGLFRFNSTTPAPEMYYSAGWNTIATTANAILTTTDQTKTGTLGVNAATAAAHAVRLDQVTPAIIAAKLYLNSNSGGF
jgi:hypothetical protein